MKKITTLLSVAALAAGTLATNSYALEVEPLGVEIHGFVSQGFIQSSKHNEYPVQGANKGSFNFNDYGVNFSKQISPDLRVAVQFFGEDRGYYGHDAVTLDYAYGDYRVRDWLGFRAGKIKVPMGLYNETRDADALRTFVFLPQGIYKDSQRESIAGMSGVSLYGTSPSTPLGTFAYQVQAGAINIANDSGIAEDMKKRGTYATVASVDTDIATNYALEWRTPLEGLRVNGTYLRNGITIKGTTNNLGGPFTAGSNINLHVTAQELYVLSTEYTFNDLVVAAEYEWQNGHADTTLTSPTGVTSASHKSIGNESYYLSATYRLSELLELGGYYSITHGDKYHPEATKASYTNDAALALKIDPVKNLTLKVEGHYLTGTSGVVLGDLAAASKDSYMFATKVTYSF
jgi:hypothetical protein